MTPPRTLPSLTTTDTLLVYGNSLGEGIPDTTTNIGHVLGFYLHIPYKNTSLQTTSNNLQIYWNQNVTLQNPSILVLASLGVPNDISAYGMNAAYTIGYIKAMFDSANALLEQGKIRYWIYLGHYPIGVFGNDSCKSMDTVWNALVAYAPTHCVDESLIAGAIRAGTGMYWDIGALYKSADNIHRSANGYRTDAGKGVMPDLKKHFMIPNDTAKNYITQYAFTSGYMADFPKNDSIVVNSTLGYDSSTWNYKKGINGNIYHIRGAIGTGCTFRFTVQPDTGVIHGGDSLYYNKTVYGYSIDSTAWSYLHIGTHGIYYTTDHLIRYLADSNLVNGTMVSWTDRINSVVYNQFYTSAPTKTDTGIVFSGSQAIYKSETLAGMTNFSVGFPIYIVDTASTQNIISFNGDDPNDNLVSITINNGKLYLFTNPYKAACSLTGVKNKWTYILITYYWPTATIHIYFNGVDQPLTSDNSATYQAGYTIIGEINTSSWLQSGTRAHWFMIWNKALSSGDALQNWYNAQMQLGSLAPRIPAQITGTFVPANGAVNQPTTINFKWSRALDQTLSKYLKLPGKFNSQTISNYWFELTTDSISLAGIIRDSTLTDTNKTQGGLNYSTSYYWRVKAKNQIGWGSFSFWQKFTTAPPPPATVTLKVIPAGFYNPATGTLRTRDTIRVYLVDSATCLRVDSNNVVIDSVTFSTNLSFTNAPTGNYYLYVYHRNHLPVASRYRQNIIRGSNVSYDLTTDSAKAYGFNMVKVSNSPIRWGMIPGDANRDEFVDGLDQTVWTVQNGLDGYLTGDFNGDGFVDGLDQTIWIQYNGKSSSLPCLTPFLELSFEKLRIIFEKKILLRKIAKKQSDILK